MKGTCVIIRDDIKKEDCKEVNQGWDEEKQRCYDLMIWNHKPQGDSHRYFGGANDLNGLFQKYEMDPFATMRNSVDCWEANGGRSHAPQSWAQVNQNVHKLPSRFFPAEVRKGSYNSKRRGIDLDPNYIGSLNDRAPGGDFLWPW
jgi:hypothetical protein